MQSTELNNPKIKNIKRTIVCTKNDNREQLLKVLFEVCTDDEDDSKLFSYFRRGRKY